MSVALPAMQESPEDYDMLESAMRYIENAIAMDKLEKAMKSGKYIDSLWSNGMHYIIASNVWLCPLSTCIY